MKPVAMRAMSCVWQCVVMKLSLFCLNDSLTWPASWRRRGSSGDHTPFDALYSRHYYSCCTSTSLWGPRRRCSEENPTGTRSHQGWTKSRLTTGLKLLIQKPLSFSMKCLCQQHVMITLIWFWRFSYVPTVEKHHGVPHFQTPGNIIALFFRPLIRHIVIGFCW